MSSQRLNIALESGAVVLPPEGRIAVFRPRAGFDLSALGRERVHVVQSFKPGHDAFADAGYTVGTMAEGPYAVAMVCVTRSKAETRALIALARTVSDGPILIDGQKTDGIESLLREIRKRADVGEVLSKAHGKLFAVSGGDFADWAEQALPKVETRFETALGVFSADGVDPGSAALVAALPDKLPKRIADLGAGWGYLADAILARAGVEEVHLVEAERRSLECARRNLDDARAKFHWADATLFESDAPFDAVIMNPPFHQSRAAEPSLGRAFIASAARLLKPAGQLWMVANRHLPYEAAAGELFRDVEEIAGDNRFKILHASKPRRGRG